MRWLHIKRCRKWICWGTGNTSWVLSRFRIKYSWESTLSCVIINLKLSHSTTWNFAPSLKWLNIFSIHLSALNAICHDAVWSNSLEPNFSTSFRRENITFHISIFVSRNSTSFPTTSFRVQINIWIFFYYQKILRKSREEKVIKLFEGNRKSKVKEQEKSEEENENENFLFVFRLRKIMKSLNFI